jgi:hypothetical protein
MLDYKQDVDTVADIELRRETNPVATPSFKIALIMAIIVYFITRNLLQTALIIGAELVLQMTFK